MMSVTLLAPRACESAACEVIMLTRSVTLLLLSLAARTSCTANLTVFTLRALIDSAASGAPLALELPEGAVFSLGGAQLEVPSGANVTIASEGEGATIDGEGLSRVFEVSNNTALTLRRVHLLNGAADLVVPGDVEGAREASRSWSRASSDLHAAWPPNESSARTASGSRRVSGLASERSGRTVLGLSWRFGVQWRVRRRG